VACSTLSLNPNWRIKVLPFRKIQTISLFLQRYDTMVSAKILTVA